MLMADTYNGSTGKYSVWLSTQPYSPSGNTFVNIGSDASVDYRVSYGGSATGILGSGPDKTIFVDSTGGAVGNIDVSATRTNGPTSSDASISASDYNSSMIPYSNASFDTLLRNIMSSVQMFSNAYILRIFGADWKNGGYHDLYVFIYDYSLSVDWKNLSDASVTLSCYRRNLGTGFGSV